MRKLCIGLLFSALVCTAADKPRAWQNGKLLDTERTRVLAGTSSSLDYGATAAAGGIPQSSQSAVYQSVDSYAIEGTTYAYVVQEIRSRFRPTIRPPKPANVTVNREIRYAVEREKLFFIDEDGKEHQTEILKKILRADEPVKAANASLDIEFDRQMKEEFPEIIADSQRVREGKPPLTELWKRASTIYQNAVTQEPNLKGSPNALLMALRQAKAELAQPK